MNAAPWILLGLLILLLGAAFIVVASRRGSSPSALHPPRGVAEMGYGQARWEREAALWRGVLRRLEIQRKHQATPSDSLLQQMEEARVKLAEAERHLP